MESSKDAAVSKRFVEKDTAYKFMAKLNQEYDQLRIQILGKEDISSLNEVIFLISTEEKLCFNRAQLMALQW